MALSDEIGSLAKRYAAMKQGPPKATISPNERSLKQVGREMLSRLKNPPMEAGLETEVFTEPLNDYVDNVFSNPVAKLIGHTVATGAIPKTRGDVVRMGAGFSKLGALKGSNPEKMLKVLRAKSRIQDLEKAGRDVVSQGLYDKMIKMEGLAPTGLQKLKQAAMNYIPLLTPSSYSMNKKKADRAVGVDERTPDTYTYNPDGTVRSIRGIR